MKAVLLAVTVLLAASALPAAAQQAGEADYKNRCARCHTVAQAVDYLRAHPEAKERAAWLDRKLARHHARDAAERARIIAFLEQSLAAGAK